MALTFTDQQIKDLSKEHLGIPAEIVKQNANVAATEVLRVDLQKKDDANKVFSDNFINIIKQYHKELKNLTGPTRTDYADSMIVSAAKLEDGNIHFPTAPVWTKFQPKLADVNNGSPISDTSPDEEIAVGEVPPPIAVLKTGYADGAINTTLATAYVAGTFETTVGGFVVGQRVIVDQANISAYGTVTAIDTPPPTMGAQTVTLNVLAPPSGALGIGARVRNFHPGFTNLQRTGVNPIAEPEYYAYLTAQLDTKVAAVEPYLVNELAALNANDAIAPEATEIATAKTNVQSLQTTIDTWQAVAAMIRYGDASLAPLEAAIAARPAQITSRVGEITTALGSVSQNPDGSFSGTKNYLNLFNFINIRVNKIEGSLTKFYGVDLIKAALLAKIATLTDKQTQYDAQFIPHKFTADSDGTDTIKLDSVTGYSVSDSIKIMDDDQPVLTATILAINVLNVQLSAVIPTGYLVSKLARTVKQL